MVRIELIVESETGVETDKMMKYLDKRFLFDPQNNKWLILDGHWNVRTVHSITRQKLSAGNDGECSKGNIFISDCFYDYC